MTPEKSGSGSPQPQDPDSAKEKPGPKKVEETEEQPESADSKPDKDSPRRRRRRRIVLVVLAILFVAGAIFGIKTILFYRHHAETDDAQIEAHIDPVLPKVSGYVTEILVDDNQRVEAGQPLLSIDTRDLQSRVDTAEAAAASAEAKVSVAQANVASARVQSANAAADVSRYAALRAKEEVSQQQFDTSKTAAGALAAGVSAAQRAVSAAQAEAAQKRADLEYARLQLSYAKVVAPGSGVVSRKSVEVGQYVQAGQPLLAIVEDGATWVVANFKETQVRKMRVGQPVEIEVDAYPKVVFHGKVDSFAAATGARFALLPPDNATGNFTKVVQRIPVKIVFTDPPDPARPLRAGMNVTAIVRVS
jgi:membrane fusion protein, multidrug efflux system